MVATQPASPMVMTPVSVSEISKQIVVTRPYFAFQELSLTADGELSAVIPQEQPLGTEQGAITAAEIGRHLAILGSCAVAQRNTKDGQHYYLAAKAHLRQLAKDWATLTCRDAGDLIGLAKGEFMDNRTAQAEASLVHRPSGRPCYHLSIAYHVISQKLFDRLFASHRADVAPDALNPYKSIDIPLGDVFEDDNFLSANLGPLDPSTCAGHFPNYPALPVAILMYILSRAAGRLLANIMGIKDIPFTVVDAQVKSDTLAFPDEKLHLVVEHKGITSDRDGHQFYCRAIAEGDTQRLFGEMEVTLRVEDGNHGVPDSPSAKL